jgi:hypothetical protein
MSALVISTPAVSLKRLALAYWLPSAAAMAASYWVGSLLLIIFSALFVAGLLIVSLFEALRGAYQVTIDREKQLVIAVQAKPLGGVSEPRAYELSSFEAVATTWDENVWSYRVDLVQKDGRGRLLVRRFLGPRLTGMATDPSAGLRAQLAAFSGLRDAGFAAANLPESTERRTRSP